LIIFLCCENGVLNLQGCKINTPTVQEAQITPEVIRPLRSNSIIDDNNDITYRLASNTP